MAIDKKHVADVLEEIGVLLELKGDNPFRCIAYSNAARAIDGLSDDVGTRVAAGTLTEIKGVGDAIAEKITELVTTGHLKYYEELRAKTPPGLLEMLRVQGLGPKRVKLLHDKLHIKSLQELEAACRADKLLKLAGFGRKTQENILKGLAYLTQHQDRHLYPEALAAAQELVEELKRERAIQAIEISGSLRRKREIIRDVDLLVASAHPERVMARFTALSGIERILAHGDTKSSVILKSGIQSDLRVVTEREFPYALHYFTGSQEHNTAIRGRAKKRGMKLSEYGLFKGKRLIPCKDEEGLFKKLGLAYIEPELREQTGEIEAAEEGRLPRLIERHDLRGVFHAHTHYSDGAATIEHMVKAALEQGLEYIGLSDHSQSARYANGMTPETVLRQHQEIAAVAQQFPRIRIFKGAEVDILSDGRLDYPEDVLQRLDFVIASVHSGFTMSEADQTRRILKALAHPRVTFLGHPTGRLLLSREPYAVDLDAVLRAAAQHRVIVEINANPQRLDLDWRMMKHAKALGVTFSINPDAHRTEAIADVTFGVGIARKGWLERADVVNTQPVTSIAQWLMSRHGQ